MMSEKGEAGEVAPLSCPKIVRGQAELMPEQEACVHQLAQARIAAMISTATIDEAEAERHVWEAYRVAGLGPVPVRWFDSPIAFVRTSLKDNRWASVKDRVGVGVPGRVLASLEANLEASVRGNVWTIVYETIRQAHLWNTVGVSVYRHLWDTIKASVPATMGNIAEASAWDSLYAYHELNGPGGFQIFHELFEANDLIHEARLSTMLSGYRLGSKEAWLVRKPIRLERDSQGHFHSADGRCVQYRDGWGFYAWHGVRVPAKVALSPEALTKEDWRQEKNREVRLVIQERLGPERFIALVGGTCIDRSLRGELLVVDLGDDPERVAHYVHIQDNSTERHSYLRVPPIITRADEAVAWTFGLASQTEQET
jgi:hypothetical protein